jgi:hypothetical protein
VGVGGGQQQQFQAQKACRQCKAACNSVGLQHALQRVWPPSLLSQHKIIYVTKGSLAAGLVRLLGLLHSRARGAPSRMTVVVLHSYTNCGCSSWFI